MQVVICDDDEGCCSKIENWLMAYENKEKVDMDVMIYNRAESLLKHMKQGQWFDVIFLDIELPRKTGVDLAREIRQKMLNDAVYIIFISGKTKYCLDLFELEPLNFHQKPLKENDIVKDIEKILHRKNIRKKVFKFQYNGVTNGIFLKDIMYIESVGNMVEIATVDGKKVAIRASLQKLKQEYQDCHFCQCHRSFLVNLNYIQKYHDNLLYLTDGSIIPVGKTYVDEVKRSWINFDLEDW